MASRLSNVLTLAIILITAMCSSCVSSQKSDQARELPTFTSPGATTISEIKEGPVLKKTITVGPTSLKLMVQELVDLPEKGKPEPGKSENKRRSLYWLKGFETEGKCGLQLSLQTSAHNEAFSDGESWQTNCVTMVSVGQSKTMLPDGFAIPLDGAEELSLEATGKSNCNVTIYLIKDSDLFNPVTAVYPRVVEAKCNVKPGTQTHMTEISDDTGGLAHRNRTFRFAVVSIDPPDICSKVSIVSRKAGKHEMFSSDGKPFASSKGIFFPEDGHYAIEATYNNKGKSAVDATVTVNLLFDDMDFKRPKWSLPDSKADYCGIKPKCEKH